MDTITLAAAATEATRGWGGPIALALVLAAWTTVVTAHQTWLNRVDDGQDDDEDEINIPSPTPPGGGAGGSDTTADLRTDTTDTGGGEGMSINVLAEIASQRLADRTPYTDIVRELMGYRVSESTAKRAVRRARVPDHTSR